MTLDNYKIAIQRIAKSHHDQKTLRIAMDAVVEVALRDYLTGGMTERDYGWLCVAITDVIYPPEAESKETEDN